MSAQRAPVVRRDVANVHGLVVSALFPGGRAGGPEPDPSIVRSEFLALSFDGAVYGSPTPGSVCKHARVQAEIRRLWLLGHVYILPPAAGEDSWANHASLSVGPGQPACYMALTREAETALRAVFNAHVVATQNHDCADTRKMAMQYFLEWGCRTQSSDRVAADDSPMMLVVWSLRLFNANNLNIWSTITSTAASAGFGKHRQKLTIVCADHAPVTEDTKAPGDVLAPEALLTPAPFHQGLRYVRSSYANMSPAARAVLFLAPPRARSPEELRWMEASRLGDFPHPILPAPVSAPARLAPPGAVVTVAVSFATASDAGDEGAPRPATGETSVPEPPASLCGKRRAEDAAADAECRENMASLLDVCSRALRMDGARSR